MDAERRRDRAITPPSAEIVPYHLLPLQRKGFPICPYYAIRAHLRCYIFTFLIIFKHITSCYCIYLTNATDILSKFLHLIGPFVFGVTYGY